MNIREIQIDDIPAVLPLYISYYNDHEGGCWTEETAGRRIRQVLGIDGAYGLIAEEDGTAVAFVMGYFKQYDDITGYTLEEIVVEFSYQNRGLGSLLLHETEQRVKARGASCIELLSVNDVHHDRFYGKARFTNAKNFVAKVRWFDRQ